MGAAATAIITTITAMTAALAALQQQIDQHFEQHPDAAIYHSMPALGSILSARVLGEFGDDPTRWPDPASRRAYARSAPITRASGKKRLVLARHIRNRRLHDAVRWWAFAALSVSPGARAHHDHRRAAGDSHEAAPRRLASKLIGQLHHCPEHHILYNEATAWPQPENQSNPAPSKAARQGTAVGCLTAPWWPSRTACCSPVWGSHSRTV
jgi:transposase